MSLKTKPWELWTGKVVMNPHNKELYVQTPDSDWQYRIRIWQDAMANGICECPMPLPKGHVNFDEDSGFLEISNRGLQKELFDI